MSSLAIAIRMLTADDAIAFSALRLRAIDNSPISIWTTREEEQARSLDEVVQRIESNTVFGAFDGQDMVGVAGIRREALQQLSHKASIWGVFVDSNQRGKGIARDLLHAAIDYARGTGQISQLHLGVNTMNAAASQLYESIGFTAFGVEPRAMRVGDQYYDERHMVLRLN